MQYSLPRLQNSADAGWKRYKANLCNFGVLHLNFMNPADYDRIQVGSKLVFPSIREHIAQGDKEIPVEVDGQELTVVLNVFGRQREYLLAGGALNYVKKKLKELE